MKFPLPIIWITLFAGGCVSLNTLDYGPELTTFAYTEPARSGLIAVRPFPNTDDSACQALDAA